VVQPVKGPSVPPGGTVGSRHKPFICAIFFLSCAIRPLTIIIITVLHFNYAKLISPHEYLILPIYFDSIFE